VWETDTRIWIPFDFNLLLLGNFTNLFFFYISRNAGNLRRKPETAPEQFKIAEKTSFLRDKQPVGEHSRGWLP
jgi:hypothetical protein